MAFEIVQSPHLPPHRCAACGCTEEGPYAFLPYNAAWENGWVFLCKKCIGEMSHALGITKETVEVEVVKEVEVVRDPTNAEMLTFIAARFSLIELPRQVLTAEDVGKTTVLVVESRDVHLREHVSLNESSQQEPNEAPGGAPADPTTLACVCGREFTAPNAAAKLGSHRHKCEQAKKVKEVGAHG